jgi:tetratricopeptide (TPR) repeat protein
LLTVGLVCSGLAGLVLAAPPQPSAQREAGARLGPGVAQPFRAVQTATLAAQGSAGSGAAQPQSKPAPKPAPAPKAPAAQRARPKGFDTLANAAADARAANRLDEAIALYTKAVEADPAWTEGHWHLGTIYYELDRFPEARDAFRRVTQQSETNGAAWAFKAHCEFRLKNYETSLSDFLRARALGAGDNRELQSLVLYHVAIMLSRFSDYEMALQTLNDFALAGNDSPRVIEAMGIAALRLPMLPEEVPADKREMVMMAGRASYFQAARSQVAGRRAFEELVRRYPDTPHVHYAFGVFLLTEEADEALKEFERELKVSPAHYLSMLQIAFEHIKRGDYEAARPWAKQAVEVAPNAFVARKAWGQVLLETGDVEAAVAELEAGVKMAPDSPQMRFILARAYQRAGRTEDAERERVEFAKLDRQLRASRAGAQSVGGIEIDSATRPKAPR